MRSAKMMCWVVLAALATGCSSNNAGKIEGTSWTSNACTIKGNSLPAGALSLEFRTDQTFVYRAGDKTMRGTYSLGNGDYVTLDMNQVIEGRKSHVEQIVIDGDRLKMTDSDGTTVSFRRINSNQAASKNSDDRKTTRIRPPADSNPRMGKTPVSSKPPTNTPTRPTTEFKYNPTAAVSDAKSNNTVPAKPPIDAIKQERFQKPAASSTPTSYFYGESQKGDYIGQGKTLSATGDTVKVWLTQSSIRITLGGDWNLEFAGPNRTPLEVGEYLDARRHPFNDDRPGICFSGNGRGSNTIVGKFVIWELEVDGDNSVKRLAVDFVQHSEGMPPALFGVLRLNSTLQ